MSEYIKLSSIMDVKLSSNWEDSRKFDAYRKYVDKNDNYVKYDFAGISYRICLKKERDYTKLERFGRFLQGIFYTLLTLGFSNLEKENRHLFTKSKKVLRFAVKNCDVARYIRDKYRVNNVVLEHKEDVKPLRVSKELKIEKPQEVLPIPVV